MRAHYVTLALCAPLLIGTPASLVVTLSAAIPEAEQAGYGAAYGMAKVADDLLSLTGRAFSVDALAERYRVDVSS